METKLGKIEDVFFGYGGYQKVMIGFNFVFTGKGWSTVDFWGSWSGDPSPDAKWTKEDRNLFLGESLIKVENLMVKAKVKKLEELNGVPVEITFDGNMLKSWRILTEVV